MPSGRNTMSTRKANDFKEKYQHNYINKYSLLFLEKEALKAEVNCLKQTIEELKQSNAKLISNAKKYLVDVYIQTDGIVAADVEIQTE